MNRPKRSWKKWLSRITVLGVFGLFLSGLFAYYAHREIEKAAEKYCFESVEKTPAIPVALVLGTIDTLSSGYVNMYFQQRMKRAAALYHQGKVKHFILSGDNHIETYDEPEAMRLALIELGVPDSCLTLDYAGFRTLDSIIRCKEVFGQDSILVVSQRFHNLRAVYIARQRGIIAFGSNAPTAYGQASPKREYLARSNAWLDLHILNTQPKFLGKKITLPISQ